MKFAFPVADDTDTRSMFFQWSYGNEILFLSSSVYISSSQETDKVMDDNRSPPRRYFENTRSMLQMKRIKRILSYFLLDFLRIWFPLVIVNGKKEDN